MAYQLKTTNIKGKDYVQVNERIIAFRKLPDFKGYSIETEMAGSAAQPGQERHRGIGPASLRP